MKKAQSKIITNRCLSTMFISGEKQKNDSRKSSKPANLERLRHKIVRNVEKKKKRRREEELINRLTCMRNLFCERQNIRIKPIENSDGTYIQCNSDDVA